MIKKIGAGTIKTQLPGCILMIDKRIFANLSNWFMERGIENITANH
ncbi:MAG: hypothetical protein K4571_10145 [Deltaproteobacteria bacterium]